MPSYYFISDVHLGYGPPVEDRERENRLVRLLDEVKPAARLWTEHADGADRAFRTRPAECPGFFAAVARSLR